MDVERLIAALAEDLPARDDIADEKVVSGSRIEGEPTIGLEFEDGSLFFITVQEA